MSLISSLLLTMLNATHIGISRSARGYCISLVIETMKTYSSEDGLTEEALVTKLRTCQYHHLFLHTSLRNNSSGLKIVKYGSRCFVYCVNCVA